MSDQPLREAEPTPPTDLREQEDTMELSEVLAYISDLSKKVQSLEAMLADATCIDPDENVQSDWKRLGVTQDGRLILESWARSSKPLYRTLIRRENASPQWQVLVENSDYNAQRSYFNGWDGRGRYDAGDPPVGTTLDD